MGGLLQRSIESQERLEMIYLSEDGTISQRCIKVLNVSPGFIKGYCYTKRHFRTFKMGNILSIAPIRRRA